MAEFTERVYQTIRRNRMLAGGESVLVALSGGVDSVALLTVLLKLASRLELTISAAHFNHRLRAADSDRDETFVRDLCSRLKIPLQVGYPLKELRRPGANLENEARLARYDFLAGSAFKRDAVVATGHNLDDQAETMLMKLFRGSGPSGLTGIYAERTHAVHTEVGRTVRVIRPLLEVSRREIETFLSERGLESCVDHLNSDLSFDRNWVRHHLLPEIEGRLNPKVKESLFRTATLFGEVSSFLEKEAARQAADCLEESDGGTIVSIDALKNLDIALQRIILRQAIERQKGDLQEVTAGHVDDLLALSMMTSGRQLALPGGIFARREFEAIVVGGVEPIGEFAYRLHPPGELFLDELGRGIRLREMTAGIPGSHTISLRADTLTVRNRRPGDRLRLWRNGPAKKLKKLFSEHKIPLRQRDRLIVLEASGEVVWVEGLPCPEHMFPDPAERRVFSIEVWKRNFLPSNDF